MSARNKASAVALSVVIVLVGIVVVLSGLALLIGLALIAVVLGVGAVVLRKITRRVTGQSARREVPAQLDPSLEVFPERAAGSQGGGQLPASGRTPPRPGI